MNISMVPVHEALAYAMYFAAMFLFTWLLTRRNR